MRMKKLFNFNKTAKLTYEELQKRKKWMKRRSFLLAFFVLGVNAYAWFIFIAKANLSVSSNVVSWDVSFSDGTSQIQNLDIQTDDLYPGMNPYTKTITITNSSDVKAEFSYRINQITVLGEDVDLSNYTEEQALEILQNTYPFEFQIATSKTLLDEHDQLDFSVSVHWDYEATDTSKSYYRLTSQYRFDPSVVYYTLNGGDYIAQTGLTEEQFQANQTNLYLEKDDADSFFGARCSQYVEETGNPCVNFHLLLLVSQRNA